MQRCKDTPKNLESYFLSFSTFDFYVIILSSIVLVPNTYNSCLFESNTPGTEEDTQKINQKWRCQITSVINTISFNNIRLKDLSANYQFHVWKYLGFKIINIHVNETETMNKDKTVRKICVNDVSYLRYLNVFIRPNAMESLYRV